jgi:hypothetical protein
MKNIILIILISVFFIGCNEETINLTLPKSNQIVTSTVGSPIFEHTVLVGHKELVTKSDTTWEYKGKNIKVPSNTQFYNSKDSIYCNSNYIDIGDGIFNTIDKNKLCFDSTIISFEDRGLGYNYIPSQNTNSRKEEILYTGIENNVVKFTYREFSNDFARPAFFQSLTYTLNHNGTTEIKFKNLTFEIFEANNNIVRYRLIN